MPVRKKWTRIAGVSPIPTLSAPVAVFHRPNAPGDGDLNPMAGRIVSLSVDLDKVPQAMVRGGPRMAMVIAEAEEGEHGNPAADMARTLFLVGDVPDGVDVMIALNRAHASITDIAAVANSLSTVIGYSNIEEYMRRSFANGSFVRDGKSTTGFFYTGKVAKAVSDYSCLLSIATSVISCCYAGRGAGAGVDWLGSAIEVANHPDRLAEMVDAASLGLLSLPDSLVMPGIEDWRKLELQDFLIRSEFQREPDGSGHFRDVFHCLHLDGGDPDLVAAAKNMNVIESLWNRVPAELDGSFVMDAIDPDSDKVRERLEKVDEAIGVRSFIEAYLVGVPLEDLFA